MKAREKDVEREVAKYLSQVFVRWGARPVERIPVPFREGPDLTVEPTLKLVIDVKSRLENPQGLSAPEGKLVVWNQMIGVRLRDIDLLWGESEPLTRASSVVVERWLDHMAGWLPENCPDGIPALVLHRPGKWISSATLVIFLKDRRILYDRYRGQCGPRSNCA